MLLSYQRAGLYLMAAAAIGLAVLVFSQTADATETAQAATSALKLQIDTDCKAGDATFKVQNTGDAWPKSSTFSIYRILGEGKGHAVAAAGRRHEVRKGLDDSPVDGATDPERRTGTHTARIGEFGVHHDPRRNDGTNGAVKPRVLGHA